MIVSFQNCTGSEDAIEQAAVARPVSTGDADVIDEVEVLSAWKLSQPELEIANAVNQLTLDGSCEGQDDSRMNWSVESSIVANVSGRSTCLDGRFSLDLSPLTSLPCGERAKIVGQVGVDSRVLAEVVRRCQADSAFEVTAVRKSLVPENLATQSTCQVEVVGNACDHICYGVDGRVLHKVEISGSICQSQHL